MLWNTKYGSSPLMLAACVFFALLTVIYFRIPTNPTISHKFASSTTTTAPPQNNLSLVEQDGLFDHAQEGGPRIRQVSMLFGGGEKGNDAIYERAMKTHIEYGKRWGYPSHILRQDVVGKGEWSVLVFGKLLYMLSVMVQEMSRPHGKRAEWLVWFDADTIILNPSIPWSLFLPPSDTFSDIHFLGNKDWFGFNCGVFFVRVNEWSINFLTEASALPLLRPDIKLGTRAPNFEQDAMVWVLEQKKNKGNVIYQPRQWYNPFEVGEHNENEHQPGDLLIHFPGMEHKHAAMGKWLDLVDRTPDDLSIPLTNLTLQADIHRFWTRLKSAIVLIGKARDFQSRDEIKHLFTASPALGDGLRGAVEKLQKICEENPYAEKEMRKALSGLIRSLKVAEKAGKAAGKAAAGTKGEGKKDEKGDEVMKLDEFGDNVKGNSGLTSSSQKRSNLSI